MDISEYCFFSDFSFLDYHIATCAPHVLIRPESSKQCTCEAVFSLKLTLGVDMSVSSDAKQCCIVMSDVMWSYSVEEMCCFMFDESRLLSPVVCYIMLL